MNNLNRPIIHEETEVVLKIIPTKKAQEQIVLMQTFYQKYQEELIPILKNMILTIETEESLPNTFFCIYSYPDSKTTKRIKQDREILSNLAHEHQSKKGG